MLNLEESTKVELAHLIRSFNLHSPPRDAEIQRRVELGMRLLSVKLAKKAFKLLEKEGIA